MSNEIINKLGAIAGIAGISVGVFLLIARDVLKLKIFSKMDQRRTYRLLTLLLTLAFFIGMAGIAAYLFSKA